MGKANLLLQANGGQVVHLRIHIDVVQVQGFGGIALALLRLRLTVTQVSFLGKVVKSILP